MEPLELISFKTCPFVQRTAIVLLEKKLSFKTTYIDLTNKPDWFKKISPLGKVPIMRINTVTLFESIAINEYLEEVYPPSLHPENNLERALNRAWIEFSSELIMSVVKLSRANTLKELETQKLDLRKKLQQVEDTLHKQPYFNGEKFSLVDASFAPALMRLQFIEEVYPLGIIADMPKVQQWTQHLLARFSVQNSVLPNFKTLLVESIKNRQGYLSQQVLTV